jgi:hypothetical protein
VRRAISGPGEVGGWNEAIGLEFDAIRVLDHHAQADELGQAGCFGAKA